MVVLSVAVFSVIRPTVRIVEPFCTSRKSAVMTMFGSENATTATATANGFISNGKSGADGKTLTFDQTFTIRPTGATVNATFTLDNPAITLAMYESVAFSDPNIVITADFRLVQNG